MFINHTIKELCFLFNFTFIPVEKRLLYVSTLIYNLYMWRAPSKSVTCSNGSFLDKPGFMSTFRFFGQFDVLFDFK